jgi:protein-S-isoprenylcysteine O-methyltransferase Ste14
MIVLRPEFSWSGAGWLIPLAGIFLAEALRLLCVGFAGSATRTRGDVVPQLVHAGPYRHVRNPLYIANVLLYVSSAVLFGFQWLAVALFIYSCVQYTFIVAFEEEILRRTFGIRYDVYCDSVPRWLPSPSPRVESTSQNFDLARALRSERSTLTAIVVMIAVLALKTYFYS